MQSRMEFAYDIFNKNVHTASPVRCVTGILKKTLFCYFYPPVVHVKGIFSQKHFTQPVMVFFTHRTEQVVWYCTIKTCTVYVSDLYVLA